VGFRYTACRTAGGFDVTGYVKNLPDGRVEIVVEGEAKEIDAFLSALSDAMERHIRDKTEQTAPHSGRFSDFSVRH
jgi:acylphosphatase